MMRWLKDLFRPSVVHEYRVAKRYTYNGKPATPEQEKEIDRAINDVEKHMEDWLKRLDEEFKTHG